MQSIEDIRNERFYNELEEIRAAFCAIMNELSINGVLEDYIEKASRNGKVDIKKVWEKHFSNDNIRLSQSLNKFSTHEKRMILDILLKDLKGGD